MQLVAKLVVAFAVLALAAPALACGGEKMQTTDKQQAKPAVASAEKAQAGATPEAAKAQARPATARN